MADSEAGRAWWRGLRKAADLMAVRKQRKKGGAKEGDYTLPSQTPWPASSNQAPLLTARPALNSLVDESTDEYYAPMIHLLLKALTLSLWGFGQNSLSKP